ncbi:hypothetical protein TL16_g10715 [Triparma laevis f. inornata]|uniref:SRCR domain-containing protein n=1 Tax=Triparma laevis f. inornata TaxID=1714386 RepID=A0A9W7EPQ8_9STRA|nr:hypothetical protein TL16_g10715 [Triparma laevis f. inornata]
MSTICTQSGLIILIINSEDPLGDPSSIRAKASDIRRFISEKHIDLKVIWLNPELDSDNDSSDDDDDENFLFFKSLIGGENCKRCDVFVVKAIVKRILDGFKGDVKPNVKPDVKPEPTPSGPTPLSDAFLKSLLQLTTQIKYDKGLLKLLKIEIHRRRTISLFGSSILPKNTVIKGSIVLGEKVVGMENWTDKEREIFRDVRSDCVRKVTVKRKKEEVDEEEDDEIKNEKKPKIEFFPDPEQTAIEKYGALKVDELKDYLRWNDIILKGNKSFILKKVVDASLRGRLGRCGDCGGRVEIDEGGDGGLICKGNWSEDLGRITCENKWPKMSFPWRLNFIKQHPSDDEMQRIVEENKTISAEQGEDGKASFLAPRCTIF